MHSRSSSRQQLHVRITKRIQAEIDKAHIKQLEDEMGRATWRAGSRRDEMIEESLLAGEATEASSIPEVGPCASASAS